MPRRSDPRTQAGRRPALRWGTVVGSVVAVAAVGVGAVGVGSAPTSGVAGPPARVPAAARDYCRVEARINDLDVLADTRPARVRTDLTRLLDLTARAARVAPASIRVDARGAVDAQRRFNELYARHGWRPAPTNRDPDFLALAADPGLAAIYQRLEEFQQRVCLRRDDPFIA